MQSFKQQILANHLACKTCPSPQEVSSFFDGMLSFLYPTLSRNNLSSIEEVNDRFDHLKSELKTLLQNHPDTCQNQAENCSQKFFEFLPTIYHQIETDKVAILMGDPAAKNESEVVRSYPGFYATAAYRVANALHQLNITTLPRIISEHAHSKTGIDIHPAASIGESFCIDHGTGVVIGETSIIGNNVKVYQGVTLGALSVDKADANTKRHPTIEDNVVLYAGATVLGGETVIGAGSIIGGNVWLTASVPPNSTVYYKASLANSQSDNSGLDQIKIKTAH